ncbi:hypothetical protein CALCODRAFT_175385 [Calocera cornea HHB12733]|uniref:Uncharacterized protein n=1 Tax=Calocera cornea HHB12733 TaxID=1353952 RepID=A0A165HU10_9BASI|nr:hypothetical protein CALCODRAFT_175385 [Calocera cornea HHB12733]
MTSEAFCKAVEDLYEGITSDPDAVHNSFRDAWTTQVQYWKGVRGVSRVELGKRGARLAIVMLHELWDSDWAEFTEEEIGPVLDDIAGHTHALAEQILLDIFYLRAHETEVFDGFHSCIDRKRDECMDQWRKVHSPPTPDLSFSQSPDNSLDELNMEILTKLFEASLDLSKEVQAGRTIPVPA